MRKTATISDDGLYRYDLTRQWGDDRAVAFIGLNPSTADAEIDDPTIRRCIGFAKSWGFGSLVMLNLCAYRSTDPKGLLKVEDPIGPRNEEMLLRRIKDVELGVAAWGTFEERLVRHKVPTLRLRLALCDQHRHQGGTPMQCLGVTRWGHPCHPLYKRADTPLVPWKFPVTAQDMGGPS